MSRAGLETVPGELAAPQAPASVAAARPEVSDFDRLATVRLPLILLVLLFHNEAGGRFIARLSGEPALAGVIDWIANGLGGVRVPAFFLIAGYIFFRNVQPELGWFRRKLNARGKSVLLPMILWTSLWIAVFAVAQQTPVLSSFFNGSTPWSSPVLEMTPLQWTAAYFGAPWEMFVYPLWFLRDLFVLFLLAPLIYFLVAVSRGWFTLAMLLWWYVGPHHPLVEADGPCFFVLGAHLAVRGGSVRVDARVGIPMLLIWLLLQSNGFGLPEVDVVKLKTLAGIVSVLYLSCVLSAMAGVSGWLKRASRYSFFIFVAHEPLLSVVRKGYLHVVRPEAPWALLLAYFAVVAIVVALLVVAFRIAERVMPRVLNVMTGGRG